jgi:hypothetical protein
MRQWHEGSGPLGCPGTRAWILGEAGCGLLNWGAELGGRARPPHRGVGTKRGTAWPPHEPAQQPGMARRSLGYGTRHTLRSNGPAISSSPMSGTQRQPSGVSLRAGNDLVSQLGIGETLSGDGMLTSTNSGKMSTRTLWPNQTGLNLETVKVVLPGASNTARAKSIVDFITWDDAWERYADAVTFAFPMRQSELKAYQRWVKRQFHAVSVPARVVGLDRAIRKEVREQSRRDQFVARHRFQKMIHYRCLRR